MRKIIFALLAVVFIASSCNNDNIPVPTALYVGEKTTFTLSANGETREIEVKTTAQLQLEKSEETNWCNAELVNNNKLVVTVQPNARLAGRSATFTLIAPDRKLEVIIEQSGQPSIAMPVIRAEASSAATNYNIGVSYDGDLGNGFFVTNTTDAVHELTYYLEPTNQVQLVGITYYPRLPNAGGTVANGNFSTGSVWISKNNSPDNFRKMMDFDMEKTIQTTFLEFPSPQTDVYAVKLVIDGGGATQGGSASCREIVFNGAAIPSASEKFILPSKNSFIFSENGGETSVGVLSNSTSILATSDAGWCNVSVDGSFIKISATSNTGERRMANITVTGSEGGSQTITVRQLAPSSLLEVAGATAVNVHGEINVGEGSVDYMFDGKVDANIWHSYYGGGQNLSNGGPYVLDFALNNVSKLSHIHYYPRQAAVDTEGNNQGGNGNFGLIEVWTKSGADYVKAMDFACGEKGAMSEIVLPTPVDNVTNVRIVIITGRGGHASCSEMKFLGDRR